MKFSQALCKMCSLTFSIYDHGRTHGRTTQKQNAFSGLSPANT